MSAPDLRLRDVASADFIIVQAASAADVGLAALGAADGAITHVIVDGGVPQRLYLIPIGEASVLLSLASAGWTVDDALDLGRRQPTPVADGGLSAPAVAVDAIVMDGGRILGFVAGADARGDSRSLDTGARAEPPDHGARAEPPDSGARAEPPDRGIPAEPPAVPADEPPVRRGGVLEALAADDAPGTDAAPTTAAAPEPVRSLEAEFPEHVRLGSVAWLLVYIAQQAATSHGLGLHVAAGESIDILVQPMAGFALDGDDRGSLEVPASGESLPFQFKLRATAEGKGGVRVLAFHRGEPLGEIVLEAVVESATASLGAGTPQGAPRVSTVLATPSPQVPDLSMVVLETGTDGSRAYQIFLTSPDPTLGINYDSFGPFELELDAAAFFAEFFREIDDLPLDTADQRDEAERSLARKGAYLAEIVMPKDLREKLWEVRDRIGSIVVQSDEPWIPWELCKLSGRDGDRIVEGPFLCEAYAITRWMRGVGFKRPLHLTNLALVVPEDSALPLAPAERDYVLSLRGAGRDVTQVPATSAKVQAAFVAGVYDGWHFTGHGAARDTDADKSTILLARGDTLRPDVISGAGANVGVTHPLVFFNACQVGRPGMTLTGVGGWASRFIKAGAGAFIGAYWSVVDEPAFDFAKAVYDRLRAGTPVGTAVRDARIAIRTPGDPTWLAYTVFADPFAVIDGGGE
jgi:hypothetical protein